MTTLDFLLLFFQYKLESFCESRSVESVATRYWGKETHLIKNKTVRQDLISEKELGNGSVITSIFWRLLSYSPMFNFNGALVGWSGVVVACQRCRASDPGSLPGLVSGRSSRPTTVPCKGRTTGGIGAPRVWWSSEWHGREVPGVM